MINPYHQFIVWAWLTDFLWNHLSYALDRWWAGEITVGEIWGFAIYSSQVINCAPGYHYWLDDEAPYVRTAAGNRYCVLSALGLDPNLPGERVASLDDLEIRDGQPD